MPAMTQEEKESRNMYRMIRRLPAEKRARVMSYIRAIQEEEPPLTSEEESGIKKAYAELAAGEGESFREAFKDLL